MTNLAVIPMPVKKVRTIRRKRSRMIILTPREILDLLKAARQRTEADGQRALFFRAALTGANTARSEIATCSNGVCIPIKAWIGHGSEMMIRRYAHLRPDCFEKHLAVVPDGISGNCPQKPPGKEGTGSVSY